jgi:hypothetical protein
VVILICLLLAIAVPVYEGGLILYTRWQYMLGNPTDELKTPVLDSFQAGANSVIGAFSETGGYTIHQVTSRPTVFVAFLFGLAGFGTMLMRKT